MLRIALFPFAVGFSIIRAVCWFIIVVCALLVISAILIVITSVKINNMKGNKMRRFYRRFYASSEDDMREMVVVTNYCKGHNIKYEVANLYKGRIKWMEVSIIFAKDIEFFSNYGFVEGE